MNVRLSFANCSDVTSSGFGVVTVGLATPTVARDTRRTKAAEGMILKCITRDRTFLVFSDKFLFDFSKVCN